MSYKFVVIFVVLFGAACAEVAEFKPCSKEDTCNVKEVRITPCKGGKTCKLKKGAEASIQFDYIPNFAADKMTTSLFWASGRGDVPFSDFSNVDACKYTVCPVEAGNEQALNYSLYLSKILPKGAYTLKWLLWNTDDNTQVCCFTADVNLVR